MEEIVSRVCFCLKYLVFIMTVSNFIKEFELHVPKSTIKYLINRGLSFERGNEISRLKETDVLIPYGGGKDSTWVLSCVRYMQLKTKEKKLETFKLHVWGFVHPGMSYPVVDNIRRVFSSLGMLNDSNIEIRFNSLDGDSLDILNKEGISRTSLSKFRRNMLVLGHISEGKGREMFCQNCNFNVIMGLINYIREKENNIDYIISGDSNKEIRQYWRWVQNISNILKFDKVKKKGNAAKNYYSRLSELNAIYNREALNAKGSSDSSSLGKFPKAISLFSDVKYPYPDHSSFLGAIGFQLDENVLHFTESDCLLPMLMAHFRGLYSEYHGFRYEAGVQEYIDFATDLMRKKQYSDSMINIALSRYLRKNGIEKQRILSEKYAYEIYGLTNLQQICLVASPFTNKGKRMREFIKKYCNKYSSNIDDFNSYIVNYISNKEFYSNKEIEEALFEVSGMGIDDISFLYEKSCFSPGKCTNILEIISNKDPHSSVIIRNSGMSYISGR